MKITILNNSNEQAINDTVKTLIKKYEVHEKGNR
jgi:hypothetical protein